MVKVGIIGTNIGSMHAEIFNQIPGAKVLWLCGKNLEKTHEIAEGLEIPNVADDYREVLKDPEVDLVIIAVPTYLHRELFLEVIKYNKHIVLEKPAGVNSGEVREMIKKVDKLNYEKLIIVDHEMRFSPVVRHIKEKMKSGYLGEITNIQISKYHGSKDGQELYEQWEMKRDLGGGQVLLVGSHLVDLALFLIDFPKFMAGTVHKRNIRKSKKSMKNEQFISESEDFYRSNMFFGDVKVDLYDNIYGDGHKTMEMKVIGSKGSFIYDDVYGLFENKDGKFKKVEIIDKYESVKFSGRSLITSSLKFFLVELVNAIEKGLSVEDGCTLEESGYGLECYERCEVV